MADSGGGFSMDRITGSRSNLIVLVACAVAFIGSFLPWASVIGISVSGTDGGDGTLTLILALATAAAAVFLKDRARMISVLVGAALIVIIAVVNIADINSISSDFGDALSPSIGIGLWMVLAGGIAAAVGVFVKD